MNKIIAFIAYNNYNHKWEIFKCSIQELPVFHFGNFPHGLVDKKDLQYR